MDHTKSTSSAPETAAETVSDTDSMAASKIDAHLHVWHDDDVRFPLNSSPGPSLRPVQRFMLDDLMVHAKPQGVTGCVLVQMSFYGSDHRVMLEAIASDPANVRGIAVLDPRRDDSPATFTELSRQGVVGVRLGLGGPTPDLDAGEIILEGGGVDRLCHALAEVGGVACLLINPHHLSRAATLATRHPQVRFAIDHLARLGVGAPPRRDEVDALLQLSDLPNVGLKLSAFYALSHVGPPYEDVLPWVQRIVNGFGVRRCVWASDCPFQVTSGDGYASSCGVIEQLDGLSDRDRAAIFHGNAQRLFFDAK